MGEMMPGFDTISIPAFGAIEITSATGSSMDNGKWCVDDAPYTPQKRSSH
jgi:hypothetical protein